MGRGVEIEVGNESLMTYQVHIFIGRSTMKRCSASVTVIPATRTIIPLKQEHSHWLGPVENACIELLKPLNLEVIVLQC